MRLAKAAEAMVEREDAEVAIVAQWEVARALDLPTAHIVKEHRQKGNYLDSKEVMSQAAAIFKICGITEVIVVANPFIHRYACFQLVRKFGFIPIKRRVGWIGFFWGSLQWWTRDPVRCLTYAVLQKLTGRRGR